jgi:hypothetical protein
MRQPGRGGRCARDLWVPGPEVRNCIPVSSHSCWTSRNMQSPGLGQGRRRLVVACGCQEREIRPCSSSMTAPRDAVVPMRLPISSKRALRRAVGLFWQAALVTALWAPAPVASILETGMQIWELWAGPLLGRLAVGVWHFRVGQPGVESTAARSMSSRSLAAKRAAGAPSTTLWSMVNVMSRTSRTATWSSTTFGRRAMPPTTTRARTARGARSRIPLLHRTSPPRSPRRYRCAAGRLPTWPSPRTSPEGHQGRGWRPASPAATTFRCRSSRRAGA